MRVKYKASNKIEAKLLSLSLERARLHGELAMGISPNTTIEESYSVIELITEDIKVYEYILTKLNK